MAGLESFSRWAALVVLGLAIAVPVAAHYIRRPAISNGAMPATRRSSGYITRVLTILALGLITLSIVSRAAITGHGPFSNMYEFAVAFAWGIVAMGLFFEWRYRTAVIKTLGIVIALLLLIFASNLSSRPVPLVPALQQSVLLSVHVAVAIIAYGTFTMGFAAAVLYLVRSRRKVSWIPDLETLENISYHTVIIAFPFLTATIVLGALWADIAWGRYWGWDPKETASLVTWLLYAGYLHARLMRGWRGSRTAMLLIIGFAAVLFTFLGNYIFTGLHGYR